MADPEEDAAEAVQRLHSALERIAAQAARGARRADPMQAELAGRLDVIIARLRAALEGGTESMTTESR